MVKKSVAILFVVLTLVLAACTAPPSTPGNTNTGGVNANGNDNTNTGGVNANANDNTNTGGVNANGNDNVNANGNDNTNTGGVNANANGNDNTNTGGVNANANDNTNTGGVNANANGNDNTNTGGVNANANDNTNTGGTTNTNTGGVNANDNTNTGGTGNTNTGATPAGTGLGDTVPQDALTNIQTWLTTQLGVQLTSLRIVSVQQQTFTDSCLGLGQANESCATVTTPGWVLVVDVNGTLYTVHASQDGTNVRMADPVNLTPSP